MDWIFDNLQLIVVVATVIAVWLNNRRRENEGESADYDEDGVPDNRPFANGEADAEQAERVRRIQEEIRRKIAERRGQAMPPPMPVPGSESYETPPSLPIPPQRTEFPAPPPMPPPPPAPAAREVVFLPDESQAALERQRRLAEEMEALETRRREAQRLARAVATSGTSTAAKSQTDVWTIPAAPSGSGAASAKGVGAELRDPRALRRAVVWREVLDRPVGMR